jgi:hypothetical protein
MARHLGPFLATRDITDPLITCPSHRTEPHWATAGWGWRRVRGGNHSRRQANDEDKLSTREALVAEPNGWAIWELDASDGGPRTLVPTQPVNQRAYLATASRFASSFLTTLASSRCRRLASDSVSRTSGLRSRIDHAFPALASASSSGTSGASSTPLPKRASGPILSLQPTGYSRPPNETGTLSCATSLATRAVPITRPRSRVGFLKALRVV